jgi:hypothetical protein
MAVWYIGAGSGDGNPYGNMIATIILGRIRWKDGLYQTVFVVPVFFCRLAAPPRQLLVWAMIGVTLVLGSFFSP